MSTDSTNSPAQTSPLPLVACSGIEKFFQSGARRIEVLRGVDLSLATGQTLSIRGESGCGKSTLLNILAGIELPDGGSVTWQDRAIGDWRPTYLAKQRSRFLGFVFQSFYLIPELSALENVLLAARIAGQNLRHARTAAQTLLGELGLGERLHSRPDQLSGGERQRTAIARALINRPQLILADEPTGNLDERTAEAVMQQLLNLVKDHGTALILVTHHHGFAQMADVRFLMSGGKLLPNQA